MLRQGGGMVNVPEVATFHLHDSPVMWTKPRGTPVVKRLSDKSRGAQFELLHSAGVLKLGWSLSAHTHPICNMVIIALVYLIGLL